jgi:hypothetical protein
MTKYAGRGIEVAMNATAIGQLTSFGEVGSSRDLIDASAYGDDWKDYVLGQQDGNEINMVIAYDPTNLGHEAIVTAYDTAPDTPVTFTMTHSDAALDLDITAIITQLTRGGELGGLLQMSVTAKIVNPGVVEGS